MVTRTRNQNLRCRIARLPIVKGISGAKSRSYGEDRLGAEHREAINRFIARDCVKRGAETTPSQQAMRLKQPEVQGMHQGLQGTVSRNPQDKGFRVE